MVTRIFRLPFILGDGGTTNLLQPFPAGDWLGGGVGNTAVENADNLPTLANGYRLLLGFLTNLRHDRFTSRQMQQAARALLDQISATIRWIATAFALAH